MDQESREEYIEDVAEEYEDIREDHYDNLKDRKYKSLAAARERQLVVDWMDFAPVRPSFIGTKVFDDFDLNILLPFIDWKPFFDVWQLRGKYPNGRYPKIFNDPTVGKNLYKMLFSR